MQTTMREPLNTLTWNQSDQKYLNQYRGSWTRRLLQWSARASLLLEWSQFPGRLPKGISIMVRHGKLWKIRQLCSKGTNIWESLLLTAKPMSNTFSWRIVSPGQQCSLSNDFSSSCFCFFKQYQEWLNTIISQAAVFILFILFWLLLLLFCLKSFK